MRITRPYPIPTLRTKRVLALACGGSHAFAIVTEASGSGTLTLGPLPRGEATHNGAAGGVLMAWGASFVGALGFTDAVQSYTPRIVNFPDAPPGALVTYVAAGLVSSAAVVNGKKLYMWGDASYGRLGLGDVGYAATPVPIREPTPLELVHPDGTSLLPVQVGCGGSFSTFLAHSPMQPPGSGCYLFTSGVIGADLFISEASPGKPDARSDGADAGGVVSVSVRDPVLADNPDSKPAPVQLVPTLCTALGSAPTCVQVAAAATHYAVIARCARPTSVAANTMLTAAARALGSKVASGAAVMPPPSEPTKVRGSLYTAGFGFLGQREPSRGEQGITVCIEPRPVAGALEDEDIAEVSCGHYFTIARNVHGEMFGFGANEFGNLNTGRYVDIAMPTSAKELEKAHVEALACGGDFCIALRYPGLLGDAKARHAAKNAFSKWRSRAKARRATSGADRLNDVLHDMMGSAGIEGDLASMNLSELFGALLTASKSADAGDAAEEANAEFMAEAGAVLEEAAGIASDAGAVSEVTAGSRASVVRRKPRLTMRASIAAPAAALL